MSFLSDSIWFLFLLAALIVILLQKFYFEPKTAEKPKAGFFGHFAKLFIVSITLSRYGWNGGVGIIVGMFILQEFIEIIDTVIKIRRHKKITLS